VKPTEWHLYVPMQDTHLIDPRTGQKAGHRYYWFEEVWSDWCERNQMVATNQWPNFQVYPHTNTL
jgi:hypothetical protein